MSAWKLANLIVPAAQAKMAQADEKWEQKNRLPPKGNQPEADALPCDD